MINLTEAKGPLKAGPGGAFALITVLFFLWGFVTALNDILVPYLRRYFGLNYLQAAMVQLVFFGAYFVGSLTYYLSSRKGTDLIAYMGYRKAMSLGLLIACIGTLLFLPAAYVGSFGLFLAALFILGLGFTLLQVAANPYTVLLGPERGAATRLNLAQGVNSLGTTIAPAIGALILFGKSLHAEASLDIGMIEKMYLGLSVVLLIIALLVWMAPLPEITHQASLPTPGHALRYPQLVMGVFAIFTYVGAEVSTGSFLISFMRLPHVAGLTEIAASRYVSLYWGGLMAGRFMGAACFSATLSPGKKWVVLLLLPLGCFAGLWVSMGVMSALYAGVFLFLNMAVFLAGRFLPARTLAYFAITCCVFLTSAAFVSGYWAGWLLVGTGLFNSIMWSVIFSLALEGLGRFTSQGSSLLVMAILGAALIPPLQGGLADAVGLQYSVLLPACCYLYLAYYGLWSSYGKKPSALPQNVLP